MRKRRRRSRSAARITGGYGNLPVPPLAGAIFVAAVRVALR